MEKSKSILSAIKFSLPNLTKTEKRIADYILSDPKSVINLSLMELSEKTNSGQATIIRFCKNLGTSGYSEFKLMLAAERPEANDTPVEINITSESGMQSIVDCVFHLNTQILEDTRKLVTKDYNKAFDAIYNANKICFFGLGDAMIPCLYANIKFRRLGYTCYCDTDADMQIINACNMGKGDVAIAVSYSGNTRHVVKALNIAQSNGATTISITKSVKSNLTLYSDICLYTALSDTSVGKEIIARRISEQAVLETLYVAVAAKLQKKADHKNMKTQLAMLINKME